MSRRDKSPAPVADDRAVTVEVLAGSGRWRPLGALGLAIVSWLPSARALLQGDLDVTVAAVRFLVAVGVAWVGLGLVATVLRGYATAPAGDPEATARPKRRRTDGPEAAGAATAPPPPSPPVSIIDAADAIDVSATQTEPA